MNTTEVGQKLVDLCKRGENMKALETLYDKNIVSVEPMAMPPMPAEMKGYDAVHGKSEWWMSNHEIHSAKVEGPFVAGEKFVVLFDYDVTNKPSGKRMQMSEAGVYTVANGKVVREEFYYPYAVREVSIANGIQTDQGFAAAPLMHEGRLRVVSRLLAAFFFVSAGAMHFIYPSLYRAIVPPGLPAPAALVAVSGIAEIVGGLGLLVPSLRRLASFGLIALLIAVFPANVYMAVVPDRIPGLHVAHWLLWARLPLQVLLIGWVSYADKRRLILASASPRRQSLLREAGYEFVIHPADIDEENYPPHLSPEELAEYLAVAKAEVVSRLYPADVTLGSDTVVALGSRLLGKPTDPDDARRMLATLSGTTHRVISGVAVIGSANGVRQSLSVTSTVRMRKLTDDEIDRYVAGGQWEGKAGGYGIQDQDPFVTNMGGSLSNIVGLPMEATKELLSAAGIFPKRDTIG